MHGLYRLPAPGRSLTIEAFHFSVKGDSSSKRYGSHVWLEVQNERCAYQTETDPRLDERAQDR